MALADRIIGVESGGNPYAANPRSSARGAGQFIEQTWLDMMNKYRSDLTTGKSRDEVLALRSDPELSRAMTEAYATENSKALAGAGLPVTPGTSYLAHFAGPQGAIGVLRADPNSPAGSVLGDAAVRANPFLSNMTVADLRAWADRKIGQEAPMAPLNISPSGAAPLSLSPQQAGLMPMQQQGQGLLGGLPALAQMGMGLMGGGDNEPPPTPYMAPPVRPKVDMTGLNALLTRPRGGFSNSWGV